MPQQNISRIACKIGRTIGQTVCPLADAATISHMVTGNAQMLYESYMYFRTAELRVNGNGDASAYVGAVARTIRFGGNGEMTFAYDPLDPNVPIIAGGSTVTLEEQLQKHRTPFSLSAIFMLQPSNGSGMTFTVS